MRLAVTGGRFYTDKQRVFAKLDEIYEKLPEDEELHVIEGGYRDGADSFARQWAKRRIAQGWRVKHTRVDPLWYQYGRAAGPKRNQEIIDDYQPDVLLSFPGHKGTRDMMRRAEKAGIPIIKSEDWIRLED